MSIPRFSADSPASDITAALGEAGCVVVTGVMDAELRQSIRGELAPHMAPDSSHPYRPYFPDHTFRAVSLPMLNIPFTISGRCGISSSSTAMRRWGLYVAGLRDRN